MMFNDMNILPAIDRLARVTSYDRSYLPRHAHSVRFTGLPSIGSTAATPCVSAPVADDLEQRCAIEAFCLEEQQRMSAEPMQVR